MSISARILRTGLRFFVTRGLEPEPQIDLLRRRMKSILWVTPRPPRGTRAVKVDANGIKAVRVATPRSRDERCIFYLHGGGYVMGSPAQYRDFIWRIARATSAYVVCPYYRLAPEHPFPAAVDDAVTTYSWLLAQGAHPRRLVVMGDSAGGGLALATLLRLRDEGVPLPAAAVMLSPWIDLALTGESMRTNSAADLTLRIERVACFARHYLGGADPRHPYASPLYGDAAGLPPILMQVGSDELLRDDAVRMADRLRAAGSAVELEIWPRMLHVFQLYARVLPEGRRAIERIGAFVERELSRLQ
jgi:epsilon-lactone hydrolase